NAPNRIAFFLYLHPTFQVDRTRNAAAQNQVVVRSVDDGVRRHFRQVALLNHNSFRERLHLLPVPFGPSFTTTTRPPMRCATLLHSDTVSSEVYGVRISSTTFIFRAGCKKRMPTQRSRETVTSEKSEIDSDDALLAKIAPVFANLSKIVNSSSFISNSS